MVLNHGHANNNYSFYGAGPYGYGSGNAYQYPSNDGYGYGNGSGNYYNGFSTYGNLGQSYAPSYSPFGFGVYSTFNNGW